MSKKKVAKQLGLTAAVAASAVVAANPASAASASTVETAVVQAEKDAIALGKFYRNADLEVSADFSAAYNKAKKSIESAKAQVATLTGSQKSLLSARVAAADANRLKAAYYIDGVKFVQNDLAEATAALAEHVEAGEITDETVEVYNNLSATIRKAERVIGKIYGSEVRDALLSTYLLDAKFAREAVIYEVSQYNLMGEIAEQVAAGKLETAADNFKVLERLKTRAVEIKEAGRALYPDRTDVYPDLPAIEKQLRGTEAAVVASYEAAQSPAVKSVSAVNAKEVVVTFNKALDKSTIIDDKGTKATGDDVLKAGVIKIAGSAASNYASLSADGKSLTIQLSSYTKDANVAFELINDGTNFVKSTDGKKVEAYVGLVTTTDTTRAEQTGIEYVTPETVRVYFSEPVKNPAGAIAVAYADGSTGATLTPTQPAGAAVNYVEFNLSGLTAGKDVNVTFNGINDYANNVSKPATVTVKKDNSDKVAPTVQSIVATSPTTFEIKFSENLKELGAGQVKVNGTAVTGTGTNVEILSDASVVKVTLASPVTGVVPVVVDQGVAKDFNSNNSAAFTQLLSFAADKVSPEITSTKVVTKNSENYLVLNFSEEVTKSSNADLAFKYTDKFGVTQTITVPNGNVQVTSDKKVVEVKLEDNAGTPADLPSNIAYNVNFVKGFFKDGFNNDSVAKTVAVTLDSTTSKLTLKGTNPIADEAGKGGTLLVDFTSAVDVASATNAANYIVEDAQVSKVELVSNSDSGAQVRVTLVDNSVEASGNYNVTVKGVKGFYSNVTEMDSVTKNIAINENVRATVTKTAINSFGTGVTNLTLTFSEAVVNSGATNDYALYVDGTEVTGKTVTLSTPTAPTGSATVTVSIDEDLSDEIAAGKSVKLVAKSTLDIKDLVDNVVTTSDIVIK